MTTRSRRARRIWLAVLATVGALASSLMLPALASAAPTAPAARLGPPNTWVATGQMGAAAGPHQIVAQGRRSFAGATITFTVTG